MTVLTAFLVLLPFVLSPGASFALAVSGAAAGDRAAGLRVAIGTTAGILVLATVAGISGLGAFVAADAVVRAWFEVTGGVLLVAFGAVPLIRARRARQRGDEARSKARPSRLVIWSFAIVVSNPKALAVYLVVVPPLIPVETSSLGGYLTIAAVHGVMMFAWLGLITVLITRVPAIATRPRITTVLQYVASLMLILLGLQSGYSGITAFL